MATTNNNYKKEQAVNYLEDSIALFQPEKAGSKYVAYVRPGDSIVLNFDLKEFKVDIVNGDVQIVFDNASTITLASLAAIGFGANAPIIKNKDGDTYRLEDFLNAIEVLNYNEATLILANRDGVQTSIDKPDVVTMASDQNSTLDEGTPISGVGETDQFTRGTPSAFINPNGVTVNDMSYAGKGNFVVTIYSSNSPYMKDQDSDMPGSIDKSASASLTTKVFYGSNFVSTGSQTFYGNTLDKFNFQNGFGDQKDPASQVTPIDISASQNQPIFVQSNTADGQMLYSVKLDYSDGIFPQEITIAVPKELGVTISPGNGCGDLISRTVGENIVYTCKSPNPLGKMEIKIGFDQNHYESSFDITYGLEYFNPATGKLESTTVNQPVKIYPMSSEADLESTQGDMLSSVANPMNVQGSQFDDIVFSGGGINSISTYKGLDRVFGGVGTDNVSLGEGNDRVWASRGDDFIAGNLTDATGIVADEHDTLYYNNYIDGVNTGLSPSDYETFNTARVGVQFFVAMKAATINGAVNGGKARDGDSYTVKIEGKDIVRNIEDIFLTANVDTVSVGFESDGWQGMTIDALTGSGVPDASISDTLQDVLQIDQHFVGTSKVQDMAVFSLDHGKLWVDSSTSTTVSNVTDDAYQTTAINFTNFESFIGSNNLADYFFDVIGSHNNKNYKIDGGTSTNTKASAVDTISFNSSLEAISFDAKLGRIYKKGDTTKVTYDTITNFEAFITTEQVDEIFASYENNYVYTNSGTSKDEVSYKFSSSAVTFDLASSKVYKTSEYAKVIQSPTNFKFDEFKDMDNKFDIELTNLIDYIIGSENNSYVINAGIGRDVLTYQGLKSKIVLNAHADGAEIQKSGGTDEFSWFLAGSAQLNVSTVVGSQSDDTFNLAEGQSQDNNNYYDGFDGYDTIDYRRVDSSIILSINYGGAEWSSVVKTISGASVGNDQFKNMESFVGGQGDDEFTFNKSVTLDDVTNLSIDLQGGLDTVSFRSLDSQGLMSGQTISLQYNSVDANSTIKLGYFDAGEFTAVTDSLLFVGVEKIEGTIGNDILIRNVTTLGHLSFSGYSGQDIIDYSAMNMALTFDMSQRVNNIYNTGDTPNVNNSDTVEKIYNIIGSKDYTNMFILNNSSYSIQGGNLKGENDNVLSYTGESAVTPAKAVTFHIAYSSEKGFYGTTDKVNEFTDKFTNITKFIGSSNSDVFNITQNDGNLVDIYLKGGGGNDDKLSFADLSGDRGLSLTFEGGVLNTDNAVEYGGYSFHIEEIENVIGTSQADIFTLSGQFYYKIDGAGGIDTIEYKDTNPKSFTLGFSLNNTERQVKVTKVIDAKSSFVDSLTNVENIILTDADDIIKIDSIDALNGYQIIDVKGGDNKLSLINLTDSAILNIKDSAAGVGLEYTFEDSTLSLPLLQGFTALEVSSVYATTLTLDSFTTTNLQLYNKSDSQVVFNFKDSVMSAGLNVELNKMIDSTSSIQIQDVGNIVLASGFIRHSIMNLSKNDDKVQGTTSNISMDFYFDEGEDILTYNTLYSIELTIDVDNQTVFKNKAMDAQEADTYTDLERIEGSKGNDTVILPANPIGDFHIDLQKDMSFGKDTIQTVAGKTYTYSVTDNVINDGTSNIDTTFITGAEKIELAGKNDTIRMGSDWITGGGDKVALIDAGSEDNTTVGDTLDFSDATSTQSNYVEYFQISGKDFGYFKIKNASGAYDQINNTDIKIENIETVQGATGVGTNFISKESARDIYFVSQNVASTMIYNTSIALTVNVSNLTIDKQSNITDHLTGAFASITTGDGVDTFVINNALIQGAGTTIIFDGGAGEDELFFDDDLSSNISSINLTGSGLSVTTNGADKGIGIYNSVNVLDVSEVNVDVNIDVVYNQNITIVEDGISNNAVIYTGEVEFSVGAADSNVEVKRVNYIDTLMGVRTMKHTDTLTRATWDIAHRDISFTLEGNAVTNGFIDEASYVNLAEINADTLDFTFDNANKNIQVNKGDVGDDLTNIMKITGSANLINKYIVDQSYSSGQAQFQIVAQANDIISFALKTEAISDLDLGESTSIFNTTGFEFLNNTQPNIYELTNLNDSVILNDADFTTNSANHIKGGEGKDTIKLGDIKQIVMNLQMVGSNTDVSIIRSNGAGSATDILGNFEALEGESIETAYITITDFTSLKTFDSISLNAITAVNNTLDMAGIANADAQTGELNYTAAGGSINNYKLGNEDHFLNYSGFNTINLIANIENTVNLDLSNGSNKFQQVTFVSGALTKRSEAVITNSSSGVSLTVDAGEDSFIDSGNTYKFVDFKSYNFINASTLTALDVTVKSIAEERSIFANYQADNAIDFSPTTSSSSVTLVMDTGGSATCYEDGNEAQGTDTTGFAKITLGSTDNTVSLSKLDNSNNAITIDMGNGGNNELNLAGYKVGEVISFDVSGSLIIAGGYTVKGQVASYGGTNFDDTLNLDQTDLLELLNNKTINGNDGESDAVNIDIPDINYVVGANGTSIEANNKTITLTNWEVYEFHSNATQVVFQFNTTDIKQLASAYKFDSNDATAQFDVQLGNHMPNEFTLNASNVLEVTLYDKEGVSKKSTLTGVVELLGTQGDDEFTIADANLGITTINGNEGNNTLTIKDLNVDIELTGSSLLSIDGTPIDLIRFSTFNLLGTNIVFHGDDAEIVNVDSGNVGTFSELDYQRLTSAIQMTIATNSISVQKDAAANLDTFNQFVNVTAIDGTDSVDTFIIASVIDQLTIRGGNRESDILRFKSQGDIALKLSKDAQEISQDSHFMSFIGNLASIEVEQGTNLTLDYVDGYINNETLKINGELSFSSDSDLSSFDITMNVKDGIVDLINSSESSKNVVIDSSGITGLALSGMVNSVAIILDELETSRGQEYNIKGFKHQALLDMSGMKAVLTATMSFHGPNTDTANKSTFNLTAGSTSFTNFNAIRFSNSSNTNITLDISVPLSGYTNDSPLELAFGEQSSEDFLNFTAQLDESIFSFADALYMGNNSGGQERSLKISNLDIVQFDSVVAKQIFQIYDNSSLYGTLKGNQSYGLDSSIDNIGVQFARSDTTFNLQDTAGSEFSRISHEVSIDIFEGLYMLRILEGASQDKVLKFTGLTENTFIKTLYLGYGNDTLNMGSEVGRRLSSLETGTPDIYMNGYKLEELNRDKIVINQPTGLDESSLYLSIGESTDADAYIISVFSVAGMQSGATLVTTDVKHINVYNATQLSYSAKTHGLGAEIGTNYFTKGDGFLLETTAVGHVAIVTDNLYNSPLGVTGTIDIASKHAVINGLSGSKKTLDVNGETELFFNAKFVSDSNTDLDANVLAPSFDLGSSVSDLYNTKAIAISLDIDSTDCSYAINFFDPSFSPLAHSVDPADMNSSNFMDPSFRNTIILPNMGKQQPAYNLEITNMDTPYNHAGTGGAEFTSNAAKWGKEFIKSNAANIQEQSATIKMGNTTVTTSAGVLDFSGSGNSQINCILDYGDSSTLSHLLNSKSYLIIGNTNENSSVKVKGNSTDNGGIEIRGNYTIRDRFVAGSNHYTETYNDLYQDIMNQFNLTNKVIDLITSVRTITSETTVKLSIGDQNNIGSFMSVYDQPKLHSENMYEQGGTFAQVDLSDEADEINIYGMEADKIVNTGAGVDRINFASGLNYVITQHDGSFNVNGFTYTGEYLTVTDAWGNTMYFTEASYNDVMDWGGNQHGDDYYGGYYNGAGNTVPYHELTDDTVVEPITPDYSSQRSDEVLYSGAGSSVGGENVNEDDVFINLVAGEDLINNDADSLLENTEALTLLENAFDNNANDDFDEVLSLQDLGTDNKDALEDNTDFVQIQNLQEEIVNQEEIENTYKLENEGTEDPLLDQSQLLHKNSNNSGNHNL